MAVGSRLTSRSLTSIFTVPYGTFQKSSDMPMRTVHVVMQSRAVRLGSRARPRV